MSPNHSEITWKPCLGLPFYEASNDGRVRSIDRTFIDASGAKRTFPSIELKAQPVKGYLAVKIRTPPERTAKNLGVHKLVCEAFHGPRPHGMQVRHLNGNCVDNRAENPTWETPSENITDEVRHGTHHQARKTHCPQGHPYDGNNVYTEGAGRRCRTSRRKQNAERNRRYRARKKAAKP